MQQPENPVSEQASNPKTDTLNMQNVPDTEQAPEASLLDYLLVIAKHKKMIFGTTFMIAVLTALYSLTLPKIYTAKTLIVPGEDESSGIMGAMLSQIGGLAGVAGGTLGGPTKTDLYLTMLKTDTIKDKIIDQFKLLEVYKAKTHNLAYIRLDSNTKIGAGKKDGVITISFDDKDPKRSAQIANAYVEELGQLVTSMSMANAGNNRRFLEGRLATTKVNMTHAEEALKEFQSKYKAFDVPDQVKTSIMGIAQLQGQLSLQEAMLANLKRQFTDASQEVKSAETTIATIKAQIGRLEGKGGGGGSIPSVGDVPQLGQEYIRLLREFKTQETILEILTKQYEMAKFSEMKNVSPVKVIQIAKVPEQHSKPERRKIVLKMAFLSLFLSIAAAFALEYIPKMPEKDRERWNQIMTYLPFYDRWSA